MIYNLTEWTVEVEIAGNILCSCRSGSSKKSSMAFSNLLIKEIICQLEIRSTVISRFITHRIGIAMEHFEQVFKRHFDP